MKVPYPKSFLRGESSFPRETPNLSIVVPFFNEIHRVGLTLPDIVGLANPSVEVVLVDDGSNDGTVKVLREAAQNTDNVHFHGLARNYGKGAAIRAGIAVTTGLTVMFMDADLDTDLADLPVLLQALESADVAIGSRSSDAAELRETTRIRSSMGNLFNLAVRKVTGLEFPDTQCGFKAFRGEVARHLFSQCQVDGFAFDVEVLVLAEMAGLKIVEVPMNWTQVGGSKVRLGIDPLKMLWDIRRIRRRALRNSGLIRSGLTPT